MRHISVGLVILKTVSFLSFVENEETKRKAEMEGGRRPPKSFRGWAAPTQAF